ncbi:adenylate/guanylate cyclase domain-containing protein [Phormidium sp. CLA17]|uniref:adenylate/guanylate cyclase domain-containing protein n=1 Tax=Leptolyngbya sp. Cla-17 TaxID=2803751 RepID=UPI001490DD78|nr:adenylate/guanylate cyclase domain-containing protein [Leptolyngbya sp. Cla-17]MBM0740781.1 adenylate/guanylate cyclase domain-containing protein [Leptolyngbya sp. Cla-17]
MTQIFYLPDENLIETENANTLLTAALEAGIPHTHVCGGNARCSTCRVLILDGEEFCAPRTPEEQVLADQLGFEPCIRLACQTMIARKGKITLRRLSLDADDMAMFFDQASKKSAPSLLGQEKHVAILFADIRGFTTFSEALLPYDVIYVLNRYFQRMAEVINRYGGTINVYMGDGFMALFGLDNPDRAAERAIRAGVAMLSTLEELNPSLEGLYQQRLRIGIGVHYGGTVIGTIGDPKNPKMTAIGDAVNLASRIEAANKPLGTTFLVSEEAYIEAKDHVLVGQSFQVDIPGKSGKYTLYEVNNVTPSTNGKEFGILPSVPEKRHHLSSVKRLMTALGSWLKRLIGK